MKINKLYIYTFFYSIFLIYTFFVLRMLITYDSIKFFLDHDGGKDFAFYYIIITSLGLVGIISNFILPFIFFRKHLFKILIPVLLATVVAIILNRNDLSYVPFLKFLGLFINNYKLIYSILFILFFLAFSYSFWQALKLRKSVIIEENIKA